MKKVTQKGHYLIISTYKNMVSVVIEGYANLHGVTFFFFYSLEKQVKDVYFLKLYKKTNKKINFLKIN